MGRRRGRSGRTVNGILLLDKPVGGTSNKVLQQVKRLFQAQKAGHTGSLDPLASGMLPICFGEATKISGYLLDADKHYWVRIQLGETRDTGDADGEIIDQQPVPALDADQLEAVLARFRGKIEQVPPMYSALKHQGKRLYELAREGVEVERKPRPVTIHELTLLEHTADQLELEVHCSKGTYVRTLAEDIGAALGCGAHVAELRRTSVGSFAGAQLHTLETLQSRAEQGREALDELLLGVDAALTHWPDLHLDGDLTFYIRQGQAVFMPNAPTQGWVRLYDQEDRFFGVGEIQSDGKVAPRRLLHLG